MCLNDATSVGIYCIVCYKTINEQFLNTMYFGLCGLFINVEILYMLGSQREHNLLTLAWCDQCIMIWCDFMWHVVVCRLWNRIIRYHMKWYVSVSRRTCTPYKQVNLCSWRAIHISIYQAYLMCIVYRNVIASLDLEYLEYLRSYISEPQNDARSISGETWVCLKMLG